ncbi:integrase arm-type DNA-binding domain-containing protein [Ideonella azotifigens]|uniref:Site-specific integrase n=2 Tax=Ideonella azotifigens TaxID=513160 RepID=A0ABP3UP79_9BURK|nr:MULTISPECIES: site-specific integrase [Ideonella]MCD2344723.1 integrase arm-type DNA-binding domain-containing protein [Ideonella azotifigens]HSI51855.1 integrase arm-type DNA-binding domain-containing protein [Ideonella sp.]
MTSPIHRLSARAVQSQAEPGYYADGAGLYLQVKLTAKNTAVTRSWLFRYSHSQRARWMGLGSARDVSLAQARQQAADCRRLLAQGKDPIDERNGERTLLLVKKQRAMSFDKCAEAYIAAHRDAWRNAKHAAQWESTLRLHASPVIGKLPIHEVELRHLLLILEPIWRDRTETASRVRGRIESILDWATVRQLRHGDNPARWRGHLDQLLPAPTKVKKVEHHAAIPFTGMLDFMQKLAGQEGTGARALTFLILTAARSGEVRGATSGEIDPQTRVWNIPATRMKAGREHRVPLSDAAWRLLPDPLPQDSTVLLFPSPRGEQLSDMTLTAVMRRMQVGAVPHGFRSTFRDWCAEATDVSREVAEMALAHAIGDKVEAAYRRGDLFEKRRKLMDEWAHHCSSKPSRLKSTVSTNG